MRILLTGATGQVGSALRETLPNLGDVIVLGREQLDLARPAGIRDALRTARPAVIVNAAAYTAVDQAESEQPLAFATNRDGPAALADEAASQNALLVHFSTDYVFDGKKPGAYVETDAPNPVNLYGCSKLSGEEAIRATGCRHLIFRTSWVYADRGKNFLLTMLRMAASGKPLRVVDDQFGAPTSNFMIADALPRAISRAVEDPALCGTYHLSAAGQTTWYGFAQAIFAGQGVSADLAPIGSEDYKTAARRPRNSVLDNSKLDEKFDIRLPSWQAGLKQVLKRLGTPQARR